MKKLNLGWYVGGVIIGPYDQNQIVQAQHVLAVLWTMRQPLTVDIRQKMGG
jgi:hypothetical protein